MKFNWEQSRMPVALVSRLGRRSELAEFKAVLSDARDQVVSTADAEAMAAALVQSGGRDYVEMVRSLSEALAEARKELDRANRRCANLQAELERRGVRVDADALAQKAVEPPPVPEPAADASAEWEEWNRKFQSLLG